MCQTRTLPCLCMCCSHRLKRPSFPYSSCPNIGPTQTPPSSQRSLLISSLLNLTFFFLKIAPPPLPDPPQSTLFICISVSLTVLQGRPPQDKIWGPFLCVVHSFTGLGYSRLFYLNDSPCTATLILDCASMIMRPFPHSCKGLPISEWSQCLPLF